MKVARIRRSAAVLGEIGGALGIVAGLVELFFGDHIGTWGGQKTNPVGLGLLTVVLGALAIGSALQLDGGRGTLPHLPSPERRAAVLVGLGVPALLCFSTVGPLWYLPGVLLLSATVLVAAAGDRHALTAAVRSVWLRALLTLLGAFVSLMALTAGPVTVTVGMAGGLLIMAGAWLPVARPARLLTVGVGAIPFAVLTWWTLITPALAVLALAVAATVATPPAHRSTAADPSVPVLAG